MPENQTVRKTNNQGFKEVIFIQIGRRGRDRELGQRGHDVQVEKRRWQLAEWAVPHSCVVDKSWKELLGKE